MRNGECVEAGSVSTVLSNPKEPYTQTLIESVPKMEIGWLECLSRARGDARAHFDREALQLPTSSAALAHSVAGIADTVGGRTIPPVSS
jgi:ABC-type glutathione transport system ATPase component